MSANHIGIIINTVFVAQLSMNFKESDLPFISNSRGLCSYG